MLARDAAVIVPETRVLVGDCRDWLRKMLDNSVHCVVTSPPYWGLRDYGTEPSIWGGDLNCAHEFKTERWYTANSAAKSEGCAEAFSKAGEQNAARLKAARWREDATCRCGAWRGSYGLEKTYQDYVAHTVEIFREVRRVLRPDGTLWLNLGDSYVGGGRGGSFAKDRAGRNDVPMEFGKKRGLTELKHKDLCGIPWRVAFALQADGWYLRQDIIWSKPNPMPESVRDRCTKAHEYLFLLSKSERYYYDADAVAEPFAPATAPRALRAQESDARANGVPGQLPHRLHEPRSYKGSSFTAGKTAAIKPDVGMAKRSEAVGRNKRSVWTISTKPFKEAHFATFPPKLVEPCILAGCPEGGIVLDPFGGAGTTGLVAKRNKRHALMIELNSEYAAMAERRIAAG